MKYDRTSWSWRRILASLLASAVLAGCSGQATSPEPSPSVGAGTVYNAWWFDIVNDTTKNDPGHPEGEYIWVTRYRRYSIDLWEIIGADCVAPGQTITRDVQFTRFPLRWPATRLRAEVKAYGAKSCDARTISDFESDTCSSPFSSDIDWIRGTAKIVVRPPHFVWSLHCLDAQGSGPYPGG